MLIVVAGTSFGDPRADRHLARGILSKPGRQDAAEDDLVDLLGGELGSLERRGYGPCAELRGRDVLELPAEAANRRPDRADDYRIFHHSLLGRL